jgi:hypothetical protein
MSQEKPKTLNVPSEVLQHFDKVFRSSAESIRYEEKVKLEEKQMTEKFSDDEFWNKTMEEFKRQLRKPYPNPKYQKIWGEYGKKQIESMKKGVETEKYKKIIKEVRKC